MSTPNTDSITTLPDHLASLASLSQQAKELMPFRINECSNPLGPVRQKIWSCRTCGADDGPMGVCYACSVSCHAEHTLVELFTRRNFTCDCPTTPSRCSLLRTAQPRNTANTYGKNFKGEFCRCERGKRYDPMEESESMIECLGCEDWFHESCLNLQDPRNPTPLSDAQSTSSSSTIESPLLPSTSYAHLLCASCITTHPLLQRYAGTEGWMMIVPREGVDTLADWAERSEVIGRGAHKEERVDTQETGEKRKAQETEEPSSKRVRLSPSITDQETTEPHQQSIKRDQESIKPCKLPSPNPLAQQILESLKSNPSTDPLEPRPKGDVFLLPEARENICTCPNCITQVNALPFPLEEEDEYEPVLEDSPEPTEESLASQALEGLPRSQTIEALLAFNNMKDKLKAFLEPFRDGGRVVSAEDIGEFMQSVKGAGK